MRWPKRPEKRRYIPSRAHPARRAEASLACVGSAGMELVDELGKESQLLRPKLTLDPNPNPLQSRPDEPGQGIAAAKPYTLYQLS